MDVSDWLRQLGLERYEAVFRDHEIDWEVLPELTESDLEKLGLPLGPRKKLLKAIQSLNAAPANDRIQATKPASIPARSRDAERRQLTVMFVDLVGSTELSRRLDPEDLGAVMRAYQGRVAEVVQRWGGHVAKYLGDGVLAYFGWPQAHEDDAERGVRAALELTSAVAELDDGSGKLAARIGIATGPVVVGELIGEGAAQEQTVLGETPNLAARLQASAAPNGVVIGATTRRLLGELFELHRIDDLKLKGFEADTPVFRVVGEGRSESRFEAIRGHQLTPLVGREHELGLLLERWSQAKDGEGQVVLIYGEPGIGKSRLIRALRERLAGEPHTPLSHYCSPHHTNSALHPVIGLLERAAGFARDDRAEARLDKLEAVLARGTEALGEAMPLVAALLELDTVRRFPAPTLSPQRQKQRTLEVLVDQIEGLANRQPVLALYEDTHWVDPTTLELLDLLVPRVQRLPVMVLITFRPEFDPPWTGHAHVMQLSLSRLTRRHGHALVRAVTRGKTLPEEVLDQILANTDGVPLFVEELTKTVLESGLLADAGDRYALAGPPAPLAIPATLHDSLMARLDRLAPVREVAQIGAVIGREFSHDLLAAVSPLSEDDLSHALDQLLASELLFRRGCTPRAVYTFKHALVQEVAYQSLLKLRRQRLHARLVEVLEQQFPDVVDQQPELLAHHLTRANLNERAAERWQLAGEKAAGRSAYREAIAHLRQGLQTVAHAGEEPWCSGREIRLQNALAVALPAVHGFAPEVKQAYERARALSRNANESGQLFRATYGLWLNSTREPDLKTARHLSDELLLSVEEERDPKLVLQAHHAAWTTGWKRGEPELARQHTEIGVQLYRADRDHHLSSAYGGHDPGVCCRYTSALACWLLGYPDQAVAWGRRSLDLAGGLRHPYSLTIALNFASLLHEFRGDMTVVEKHTSALIDLSSEQGFPLRATAGSLHEAWLLLMHGEVDAAGKQIDDALAREEALGSRMMHSYFLAWLVDAYLRAGRHGDGFATIERALAFARESQELWWEAELHRLHGELHLSRRTAGNRASPEICFRRALQVARDQRARSLELRAATSLARLWAEQGERRRAHDLLAPVYGWFTEGFDTKDLKDAKRLLDDLE